jgi:replicative DNA helicase
MAPINFDYGKVPPQATEIEAAIIGELLTNPNSVIEAATALKPDHFYKDDNKIIYKAILDMHNRGVNEIDMLTVVNELKVTGQLELAGGAYAISQKSQNYSGFHLDYHISIVTQKYKLRKLIEICQLTTRKCYEEGGREILDTMMVDVMALDDDARTTKHIAEATEANYTHVKAIQDGTIKKWGIPTMLMDLDNYINGLQPPDLIIIAGRPGMGKTAFALNIADAAAIKQKHPILFFSLEMSAEQLEYRLETLHTGIPYFALQNGKFTNDQALSYDAARSIIKRSPIYIDDDAYNNVETIRTKSIQMKRKHGIKAIFVDYIQLIEQRASRNSNRENDVSMISRGLKKLAKELDVPVIALSQLNRDVEKRKPPVPNMADLRESGAIEQDADIVMLLYRPEYYGTAPFEKDGESLPAKNLCICDVVKHRNGKVGKIPLTFIDSTMKFGNYSGDGVVIDEPIDDLPF